LRELSYSELIRRSAISKQRSREFTKSSIYKRRRKKLEGGMKKCTSRRAKLRRLKRQHGSNIGKTESYSTS
jgi:hypothetical protein